VVVALFIVVGILMWAGSTAIILSCLNDRQRRRRNRRRRPDLLERLAPYHPSMPSVADQAQEWLSRQ
jgi:hypothetical protein